MRIFIWKDNKQEGPFTENEIREQLSSGKLDGKDLAWTQGRGGEACEPRSDQWIPLSQLLSLVLNSASPQNVSSFEPAKVPSADDRQLPATTPFWKNILEKAVVTARLFKNQAHRKKRQSLDLRIADYRVGKRAYDAGVLLSGHEELTSKLIDLQITFAALKNAAHSTPTNLSEKAKIALHEGGKAVRLCVLNFKRNALLTALGAELRQKDHRDESWAAEVDSAQLISNEIRALEEKIKRLQNQTYRWARQPLWVVAVFLTGVFAWIGVGTATGPSGPAGFLLAKVDPRSTPDRTSAEFNDFLTKFRAFWTAHSDISKYKSEDGLALNQLLQAESEREVKIAHPNFAELTAPEQTKIRNDTKTLLLLFLQTKANLPDYVAAIMAKANNTDASSIPSPPERTGADFNDFLARLKAFWTAHPDPSKFTSEDNLALNRLFQAEFDREVKIAHPNFEQSTAPEQAKFRQDAKAPLILFLFAKSYIPANFAEYSKKASPTPKQEEASPGGEADASFFLKVDGVNERVCTKDGRLTSKYKTKEGALPLVREVFRLLAPAATFYTNHATMLGDLTGANDGFTGFREVTSDNGTRKWIYAQFEADINFLRPDDYGDNPDLMDVAVVIELRPINMFILDAAAFENFQAAGDVVYRNGRGVLWYPVK